MPMGSRGIYGSGIDVSACPLMVEDRSLGQQKVLANHETIDKATTSTPQELAVQRPVRVIAATVYQGISHLGRVIELFHN